VVFATGFALKAEECPSPECVDEEWLAWKRNTPASRMASSKSASLTVRSLESPDSNSTSWASEGERG